MVATEARVEIERLGRRGEGVAMRDGSAVYVPYALPGETVLAQLDGDRGRIVRTIASRPDRIAPICRYFGLCGGCAVQTLAPDPYSEWKRHLLAAALAHAGVSADVGPLVDAHGEGRRRATFHAKVGPHGTLPHIGFMEARAHRIVNIAVCPILAPGMSGALPAARAVAVALAGTEKPLDLLVTETEGGLDLDLRGLGPARPPQIRTLVAVAERFGLARLSIHGEVLVERGTPSLRMGERSVVLPPGGFLQATKRGEDVLGGLVLAAVDGAKNIADLFCGVGTFALRLPSGTAVAGFDSDGASIAALGRAFGNAPDLRQAKAEKRDLFARPLGANELESFDAVVFDPPRAGAAAQAEQIARSTVPTVAAVSCDPGTFARDAATLTRGGYALDTVTPVDQFRYAPHLEIFAVFRKAARGLRPRRRLLS